MMKSTEGKNYASSSPPFSISHPRNRPNSIELNTLVVQPEYQRRGIGKMLVEDGLKEADRLGIQAVLGASKQGLGLYKTYGFTEFQAIEINLWEYEGGEGMGTDRHVIMHRPAQSTID
jgi:predicted N-acetyltransferase YhbS